ncbi:MAG TPA: hypothetical protein VMV46_12705 [Thermoanaerobaculia bacterium]|nr:hypothetical protein [Thermoanaerobaculia bacterium]
MSRDRSHCVRHRGGGAAVDQGFGEQPLLLLDREGEVGPQRLGVRGDGVSPEPGGEVEGTALGEQAADLGEVAPATREGDGGRPVRGRRLQRWRGE